MSNKTEATFHGPGQEAHERDAPVRTEPTRALLRFRDGAGRVWEAGAIVDRAKCIETGELLSLEDTPPMHIRLIDFTVVTD